MAITVLAARSIGPIKGPQRRFSRRQVNAAVFGLTAGFAI